MTSKKKIAKEADIMKHSIGWLVVLISLAGCAKFGPDPKTASFVSAPLVINVADEDITRIVTPFAEPRVVTTSDAEITRSQHVLYVLPSDQGELSMFVTDAENEASSINLTLRPRTGGTREIDVAALGSAAIRPVGSKKESRAIKGQGAGTVDSWLGKKCRLCRRDGQSGSDSGGYGGDSGGKSGW